MLENIKDSAEYDKYVLGLFEKGLAVEGAFMAQVQKYAKGADDKVTSSEAESIRLRIVCHDDKIDQVMEALDAQNLSLKSVDMKISPLLKGAADYQKWQQSSVRNTKSPTRPSLSATTEDEDDLDEELDAEEWSNI